MPEPLHNCWSCAHNDPIENWCAVLDGYLENWAQVDRWVSAHVDGIARSDRMPKKDDADPCPGWTPK